MHFHFAQGPINYVGDPESCSDVFFASDFRKSNFLEVWCLDQWDVSVLTTDDAWSDPS